MINKTPAHSKQPQKILQTVGFAISCWFHFFSFVLNTNMCAVILKEHKFRYHYLRCSVIPTSDLFV